MVRLIFAALLLAVVVPTQADAQSVIVLGLRSVEGDDEFSHDLTSSLRDAARDVSDWEVARAEVSLEQMTLVHGCDEPDAACMAAIAEEIGVQRIIYGTVRRTGVGDDYEFGVSLNFFNADDGRLEFSETLTIPLDQTSAGFLDERAARYVRMFSGGAVFGSIRVSVRASQARVSLDGEFQGETDDAGVLILPEVPEGEHEITIEADSYSRFDGTVRVAADDQTDFRATLSRGGGTDLGWIPGAAALAVGAVLAIPWAINGFAVFNHNSQRDEVVTRYQANPEAFQTDDPYEKLLVTTSVADQDDVCSASDEVLRNVTGSPQAATEARQRCDDDDQRLTLSYVFGTLSLVAGVAGAALLIWWATTRGGGSDGEQARWILTPYADAQGGGLGALVTF